MDPKTISTNPRFGSSRALLLNALFRTTRVRDQFPYRLFWSRLFAASRAWKFPITTRIHGKQVVLNANYSYPIYSRMFPSLNAPLLQLVHSAFSERQRKLRAIDVGAAIGDTVLLIEANCPGAVERYLAVDGDQEFFDYLQPNLAHLPHCRCVHAQLAASAATVRSLVRIHGGTASAQGALQTRAVPLDDVIREAEWPSVDLLKVDVDGFDGEVLAGTSKTLQRDHPTVIFEWHPLLCQQTGNSYQTAFRVLRECGYNRLVWFTKFGTFSHFGHVSDEGVHERLAEYCRSQTSDSDWHYDVIALPSWLEGREQEIADLALARRRRSPC